MARETVGSSNCHGLAVLQSMAAGGKHDVARHHDAPDRLTGMSRDPWLLFSDRRLWPSDLRESCASLVQNLYSLLLLASRY
jgi:hypothetical protein